ncbi:hypothetical protein HC725_14330 [Vibrio sp. S17_S38]|uniref:hypothetical protein n=1 Tax=Vibrio sp. S17_S38 TaxID=2720229 RepID=UPI001680CFB3|nr:hypothetical protein [Vibrio sp. S17_S38]MBD1574437.1 hypothetical protein [Vibrio sp. S17_S38]
MNNAQKLQIIRRAALRFLVLSLLVSLPVICVRIDMFQLHNGLGEISLTEFLQEAMLFISVCLFGYIAKKEPTTRHAYVLVTGFFACLLIRELDGFFDLIFHGFWVVPALIVAATAIRYAWSDKQKTLDGLYLHILDRNSIAMTVGLCILLIFSRLFGMGSLWDELMGELAIRTVKNVAEEGTEVLGYVIMFYSSLCYFVDFKRSQTLDKTTQSNN